MQRTTTWMVGTNGHKPFGARPYAGSAAVSVSNFGAGHIPMTCGTTDTVRPKGPDEGTTG